MRVEAGIERAGAHERTREQAGDDDQQDAERDLRDDERMPQPGPARRQRIVLQRRYDVRLRGVKRGRQPRQQRGDERDDRREENRARVQRQRHVDLER